MTEHWNRSPREAVECPSLEMFKTHLDAILCNLHWVNLLGREVGLDDFQRSYPTSTVLWFCDSKREETLWRKQCQSHMAWHLLKAPCRIPSPAQAGQSSFLGFSWATAFLAVGLYCRLQYVGWQCRDHALDVWAWAHQVLSQQRVDHQEFGSRRCTLRARATASPTSRLYMEGNSPCSQGSSGLVTGN